MNFSRKEFLSVGALGVMAAGVASCCPAKCNAKPGKFRYAINPATVRGYKLSLKDQVKLSIEAEYEGIEPWLADIQAAKKAGELSDIAKMCKDNDFAIVNGIGFARWSVPDKAERAKGMEEMKRDMGLMKELGGSYIAAPPFGLQKPGSPKVSLDHFVECYREVLELGEKMEVIADLEFWGHSANLSRIEEALYVASAVGHKDSCLLADVYHMYRGGSSFEALKLLSPASLPVLHMNDYPAQPRRELLKDPDRVWPGDGIAPWKRIFDLLRAGNLNPWLSIELFNKSYWATTPLETLKTGLLKMKRVAGEV